MAIYDSSGSFLKSVGRGGGGPGGFAGLGWVRQLRGDTLRAWDFRNRRLPLFTSDGTYVRSVPLRSAQSGVLTVHGAWSDGSLLASHGVEADADLPREQVARESLMYVRYGSDGATADTLGWYPGNEFYQVASREGSLIRTVAVAVPFMRSPHVALSPRGFYFGTGESYSIGRYNRDGVLEVVVRSGLGNRPVTSRVEERYQEEIISAIGNPNVRRTQQRAWTELGFPRTMPAFGSLVVDVEGNLWVRDDAAPGETTPAWQVFNSRGLWLGSVAGVPEFTPSHNGADFAIGIRVDELGAEYVHMHSLVKP